MKKIKEIKIKNFKAFQQEQVFPINGKHVLVYGNNGSGKSSLFWALYTFLQSSLKDSNDEIIKYFKNFLEGDSNTHQSLKNIFAEVEDESFIEITINENPGSDRSFKIDINNQPTRPANNGNDTLIQELNLASDFINYKLLHNFYNASHKQVINLWSVFEKDIFPFMTKDTTNWLEYIKNETKDVPRKTNGTQRSGIVKASFVAKIESLNIQIQDVLDEISTTANDFLKKHFFYGKDKVMVKLDFDKKFKFDKIAKDIWSKNSSDLLQIKLIVSINKGAESVDWEPLHRVQSFLNEAMLTKIAISIRIGSLRTRVQSTEFKILVLDDMLISLDMSNRMDMVRILLNTDNDPELEQIFGGFQKFILTHDLGFYELIQRYTNPNEWVYFKFHSSENIEEAPVVRVDRSRIDKAISFLNDGEYDACGNELRKETEALLDKYLKGLNLASTGEFQPLMSKLNSALSQHGERNRLMFNRFIHGRSLSRSLIEKFNTQFEIDITLSVEEKGKLSSLRKAISQYIIDQIEFDNKSETIIAETKDILKRIMNPASHSSLVPLYEAELRKAIDGVEALKTILDAPSSGT
jgi:hypothetical protein